MYDRVVAVPRLLSWYGEHDPWPDPLLAQARDALNTHYGAGERERFVSAGMCFYRDGRDGVAWHGDRIGRSRHEDVMVGIVSFGAPRALLLRPVGGGTSLRYTLGHGDLLVDGRVVPADLGAQRAQDRPRGRAEDQRAAAAPRRRRASLRSQSRVSLRCVHPVRAGRVGTEPLDLVGLVRLEVALEPVPLRRLLLVALVGEDVGDDPVEEPAVVADHHGAARELEQRVLQRRQGLDVEVVRGLVEQQQVAALLERQRQVEPVALSAGEDAGRLLLVGALEAERGRRRRARAPRRCRPGCSRARRRRPPTATSSGRCRRGSGRRRRS